MLFDTRFNSWNEWVISSVDINLFVGQLHIPVVMVVVEIGYPKNHGEKLDKNYVAVALAVFCKMRQHHRQFQELVQ